MDAQMKNPWHGKDIEQLFIAMGLDMGEEDVEQAAAELQKLNKPKRAVIAATIIPEGGYRLLSNVTDARLEAAEKEDARDHRYSSPAPFAGRRSYTGNQKTCRQSLAMAGVALIRPGSRNSIKTGYPSLTARQETCYCKALVSVLPSIIIMPEGA